MSAAVKCDACETLLPLEQVIKISVIAPLRKGGTGRWSDLDICRACAARPLLEILRVAGRGFADEVPW